MSEADRSAEENLEAQHKRLASLESCEERIRVLRDRETDREVEHMAAQAALQGATNRLQPGIEREAAIRIGHLLENRRALEHRLHGAGGARGRRSTGATRTVDELRTGHAALLAWLDADSPEKSGPTARYAKILLLIASIGILWAAIAVHLAFLILLAVVVGPISFAMARGQDGEWRRVGARRRYGASGLSDVGEWSEETVRARANELEVLIGEADARRSLEAGDGFSQNSDDEEALTARVADLDRRLAVELSGAGLTESDIKGDVGEWLRLTARADSSRRSLEQVKQERRSVRDEAAELRDQLVRYLHSRGVKPTAHQDSAADIAERLNDLHHSGRVDQ